jgi:hypothetical protein
MDIPPLIHGTLREHYLVLFGSAGTFAMAAGFVGAWWGARRATRRALKDIETRNADALSAGQIRALAASVEAIGLEVERVAEAQRFVAKVLVDRAESHPSPPARREPPQITPH